MSTKTTLIHIVTLGNDNLCHIAYVFGTDTHTQGKYYNSCLLSDWRGLIIITKR